MTQKLQLLSVYLLNYKYKLLYSLFFYIIIVLLLKSQDLLLTSADCMISHKEALERIAQLEYENLQLIEENARLNESSHIMKTALDNERAEMTKILNGISTAAHQEETLRATINQHLENCLKHKTALEQQLSKINALQNEK